MPSLSGLVGSWAGTNEFRLMPRDVPFVAPATAEVTAGAGGSLTAIAYAWSHPADGAQDGLLVVGGGDAPGSAIAFWADSWHQSPAPVTLVGGIDDGLLTMTYEYVSDWHWQIVVDATNAEVLVLRMDNVVPPSAAAESVPAGAYPAMLTELRRAPGDRGE